MLLLLARRTTGSVIHILRPRFCSSPPIQTPNFAHLKSPENPNSVLRLLKHNGFTEADIQTFVKLRPQILSSNPENTLNPNLRALREMGLSTSALTQIIISNPALLDLHSAVPRIKFWSDIFGGKEADIVMAFKYNKGLAGQSIPPKISLLQNRHGLSTHEIGRIVLRIPRFIAGSFRLMEDRLKRAKELGFQPGSPMFVNGLLAVAGNSREMLQKKMELLKSFGWSEDDFFLALRKYPLMVAISENNLQTKMDFLMGEVRCDISYIVSNPVLLTCSLEKRLRPRHHVLLLLESKGLSSGKQGLFSIMRMSDIKFVEKYILPHKMQLQDLKKLMFPLGLQNVQAVPPNIFEIAKYL